MTRTDEQRQADEQLTAAIERTRRAYMDPTEQPDLVTDFVVIVAATRFDDDGDETAVYDILFRDGSIRDHAAYGLLKVGERLLVRMEEPDEE